MREFPLLPNLSEAGTQTFSCRVESFASGDRSRTAKYPLPEIDLQIGNQVLLASHAMADTPAAPSAPLQEMVNGYAQGCSTQMVNLAPPHVNFPTK